MEFGFQKDTRTLLCSVPYSSSESPSGRIGCCRKNRGLYRVLFLGAPSRRIGCSKNAPIACALRIFLKTAECDKIVSQSDVIDHGNAEL